TAKNWTNRPSEEFPHRKPARKPRFQIPRQAVVVHFEPLNQVLDFAAGSPFTIRESVAQGLRHALVRGERLALFVKAAADFLENFSGHGGRVDQFGAGWCFSGHGLADEIANLLETAVAIAAFLAHGRGGENPRFAHTALPGVLLDRAAVHL